MARIRAIPAMILAAVTSVTLILIPQVASASRPAVPVLGSAHAFFPAGRGFGTVKPKTVYFGGDPTGLFTNLTWTAWGSARSTGRGKGYYPPPGKPVAAAVRVPVILVASSIGSCNGHVAYRRLAMTFVYKHRNEKGGIPGRPQGDICS
jgi:hypothetical protein